MKKAEDSRPLNTATIVFCHSLPIHTVSEEFENGGTILKTLQIFFVHTAPEEFENGILILKTLQIFTVHATPKGFKNTTDTGQFGFVFEEASGWEITGLS